MYKDLMKEQVKALLPEYLREQGINPRKMFRCICVEHTDHHPSMSFDPKRNKVKCFACGADMDIFDVVGAINNITDTKEKFRKTYEWAQKRGAAPTNSAETITPTKVEPVDLSKEVSAAHEMLHQDLTAMEHFLNRGLTAEVIEEYQLGYWRKGMNNLLENHPKLQSKSWKANLYRFIIPYPDEYDEFHYFQTEICDREYIDDWNGKYRKLKGIREPLFNERYLKKDTPPVIFVVEGLYDALAVESAGGKAVAITGGTRKFLMLCKELRPDTTFMISMDNDEAGHRYGITLEEGLRKLGLRFRSCVVLEGKDFSEMWMLNPRKMKAYICDVVAHEEMLNQAG